MMFSASSAVSGRFDRNALRSLVSVIGWKTSAGLSCSVKICDLILYGGFLSCREMASVTVKFAVEAYRPSTSSYCFEILTRG